MYYRRLICTPRCSAVIIVKAASMAKLAVVVAAPHGSSGWPLPVSTKPLAQRSQEISHLLSFWARPAWQTQQSPMRLSVCLSVCPSSTEINSSLCDVCVSGRCHPRCTTMSTADPILSPPSRPSCLPRDAAMHGDVMAWVSICQVSVWPHVCVCVSLARPPSLRRSTRRDDRCRASPSARKT